MRPGEAGALEIILDFFVHAGEREIRCFKAIPDSFPENLTTCSTPASRHASMNLVWVETMAGSELEIINARSTPSSAGPSVSGRVISPSTVSTPGNISIAPAFRAVANQGSHAALLSENSFTIAEPFKPVAPVTKIMPASE
jgi:hypothetical protein